MDYRRLYQPGARYFFTVVTEQKQPLLIENIERLRESFRRCLSRHPFEIEAIVILPDHLHTVCRLPETDADFSKRWMVIKRYFSSGLSCGIVNQSKSKKDRRSGRRRKPDAVVETKNTLFVGMCNRRVSQALPDLRLTRHTELTRSYLSILKWSFQCQENIGCINQVSHAMLSNVAMIVIPAFFEEENYLFFLDCLEDAIERYQVAVHAYIVMTNHIHLFMTPSTESGISRVMQLVGNRYVQYINKKYRRTGTLWEGRHKASLVDAERYLLTCYRYIEMNPVRARMVYRPGLPMVELSSPRCRESFEYG